MAFQFKQGDVPLPGYTIQRGVGRGGFGEVYYALSDGGKEVALKYLRENPQIELRGVSHCLNLKSPYLVGIHDIRQNAQDDYFVIMEYVTGPSLRDLLNAEPVGLGPQKAAYFLREICKGLAYLHDRGIVHRDLKPGNIFYEDGYVKIGDYGLAKLMSASQHSGQTVSVGTVHYMAPEVGSGNYDRTIDIYALGVILYEMLLGRVPFAGATMGEVLMKHLTAQPEVDELPAPYPHIIRKALAKDPKDRFQTVQEMLSELFAVPSIGESVAAFEPASLSTLAHKAAMQVNATPAIGGGGATLTGVGGSSNVGAMGDAAQGIGPAFGGDRLPPNRFDRMQGRIAARVDRMTGRIDQTNLARQISHAVTQHRHSGARMAVALMVAVGMSFGVSLVAGHRANPAVFAAMVFLHIAAIVQGVMIGTWLSYDRLKIVGVFVPRLMIAAVACAGLLGSSEIADALRHSVGAPAASWVRALALSMVFCDWAGRFYAGRQGKVSLGSAFSVGLFGLVAGILFSNGQAFTIAVIAAAASLVIEAVGSLWPLPAGAVVPKTSHDNEEKEESADREKVDSSERVAVEPGFRTGSAATTLPPIPTGRSKPPAVPATRASKRDEIDPRMRRSSLARAGWLFLSVFALCGGIVLYATPHLVENTHVMHSSDFTKDREIGIFTIAGTAAMCLFLFFFTRSWSGYKVGLWRGILRPAIFFGGIAFSAGCGIAFGLLDPPQNAQPALLGGIILGALMALFVWFVPVRPYRGIQLPSPEEELARQARNGRRMIFAGAAVLVLGVVQIAVLAGTMGNDAEDVLPVLAPLIFIVSATLITSGIVKKRRARPGAPAQKLALPLRTVFEIDANPNIGRLIERHMNTFGYKLTNKADLLWSFERGTWFAQFWQDDIRQWKVKFNVAAYELDTGGCRVTCFLDLDAPFHQPSQTQLVSLAGEFDDLKSLLGGRDVPSSGAPAATVSVS